MTLTQMITISLQYTIFQQKYLKHNIALHFPEVGPKKTEKYRPRHRIFSLEVYPSPENFTQPLDVMVMTFSKSVRIPTGKNNA